MSIVYMHLGVSIHGLKVEDQETAENFLKDWIRAETLAGLKGRNAALFNFRDEFESDIEVEIEEHAGIPDIQKATEEQEAREILTGITTIGETISGDTPANPYDLGQKGNKYIHWLQDSPESVTLDDDFTIEELEAIVWWMKNKGK